MSLFTQIVNWFKTKSPTKFSLTSFNSAAQTAVAQESFDYWNTVVPARIHAYALLGNEEGETSFDYRAGGDKVKGVATAHGIFQWHQGRIDDMKAAPPKGCGIDVSSVDCSHLDMLKAAHWEMTQGSYKNVWPKLISATTLTEAVTVLVHDYERSGSQSRDVARRLAYAQKWQDYFEKKSNVDNKPLGFRITPVAYSQQEFKQFVDKLDLKQLKWHPRFITLHNTATPTLKQWSAYGPALQKRWPSNLNQYYSNLHWHSSVHLVITPDHIWNLCNLLEDGISVSCWNKFTIGIEQVGDYSTEEYNSGLGLQVQENAIYAMAVLCNKFGWNPADYQIGVKGLHFHKECTQDHHDCPGKNVIKPDVVSKIVAKMNELKNPAVQSKITVDSAHLVG